MTTEIKVTSAPDLSVENDVLNFRHVPLPVRETIAGASWLVADRSPHDTLLFASRYVSDLIERKLPHYTTWLFVGHSTWQPDTRIVRYRKLWGSLKAQGIDLAAPSRSQEVMVKTDRGLKFFGAIRLSEVPIELAVKALLTERCSYFVGLPKELNPQQLLEKGWSSKLLEDSAFIARVCQLNGLLIKPVGEFDDREKGIVTISHPPIIHELLSDGDGLKVRVKQ